MFGSQEATGELKLDSIFPIEPKKVVIPGIVQDDVNKDID
jgi:hypothetical protein